MRLGDPNYEPSKDPFWLNLKREIEEEQNDQRITGEYIATLEKKNRELSRILKGVRFLLASQAMKNGGELRLSKEFILDHAHQDVRIIEMEDPSSTDTIYKIHLVKETDN